MRYWISSMMEGTASKEVKRDDTDVEERDDTHPPLP